MAQWNVMDNFDFTEVFPKSVKVEKAKMAEFDEILCRLGSQNTLWKWQFLWHFEPKYHFRKLTNWTIEILHDVFEFTEICLSKFSKKWNYTHFLVGVTSQFSNFWLDIWPFVPFFWKYVEARWFSRKIWCIALFYLKNWGIYSRKCKKWDFFTNKKMFLHILQKFFYKAQFSSYNELLHHFRNLRSSTI